MIEALPASSVAAIEMANAVSLAAILSYRDGTFLVLRFLAELHRQGYAVTALERPAEDLVDPAPDKPVSTVVVVPKHWGWEMQA